MPLAGLPPWEGCPACRGTFVEREAVARLLRGGTIALPGANPYRSSSVDGQLWSRSEAAVRYLRCPRCGDLMNRMRVLERVGVVVDACLRDGVWFDAGELEQALEHLRQQQSHRGLQDSDEGAAVLGQLFALFFQAGRSA